MTRRYDSLKLTFLLAALVAGLGSTNVSAQDLGACCYDLLTLPGESSAKSSSLQIDCVQTSSTECTDSYAGTFEASMQCGTPPFPPYFFSILECQNATTILPVELTSFEALQSGSRVVLAWTTASEFSNAGFSVEHQVGAEIFGEIGYVEGHGTTIEPKDYRFETEDLDPGQHRFRLKQIDFDGAFEYSPTIEAVVTVPDRFLIEPAYPNPFNPSTTLSFAVAAEQHVDVTMVNSAGQSVQSLFSGTVAANEMKQLRIEANGLPSGTYLVHFEGNGLSATQRIVLAK